ncbi:STM4015 family protein [Streptosporangium sp. NPDC049376]|uniref:STM4015 family protein n=1 Tax=Streptosporangium sp. NPDC049376 TaxID=3366192 RepID=UPI0037A484CD
MDYPDHADDSLGKGTYAGLPIAHAPGGDDGSRELPAPEAAAWRIGVGWDGGRGEFEERFLRFFRVVDTTKVAALIIGNWGSAYESDSSEAVRLLTEHAERLPALRTLYLGAISREEAEISWIQQSDVTPLLTAFPLLERLEVRGGSGLGLSPVRHEHLKDLTVESGGLPARVVRGVAESTFPALEHLELWLGVDEYGGDATLADMAGILSGERLPALRHLGLQNSEIQDEIAAAVASAPVVARLETLALSMGALGDEGAEALLSGQPLTHLRRLDLYHHYLTDPMVARVKEAFAGSGVEVDLSEQEEPDDEWRYVAVSE